MPLTPTIPQTGNADQFDPKLRQDRSFLLLQGLMGRLFRRLGQGLIRAGYTVHKVNFNGGDRMFWRLPNGIDYLGTLTEWPEEFERLITELGVTDVVLFGDCRDHHMLAIPIARKLGITVHVFEEGYIRPDWVTLEQGGVNGHSNLPRDPAWYQEAAASLPPLPPHGKIPSSFRRRAWEAVVYNTADVLTRWHYKNWTNHRPWHPLVEGVGWLQKLNRRQNDERDSQALIERLEGERYFLFPLQLDSDAQIRLHSPFAGVAHALKLVINSFAEHAPADTRLVVKEHPLDNGVRNWRLLTADIAALAGIADRVDFLARGKIEPITRGALGMVTINSTSGTLALAEGIPVKVLGMAVFDVPGVTFAGDLDDFWNSPPSPDKPTYEAFYRVLVDRCLIPGGFFSEAALEMVVQHAIARLEGTRLLPA